LPDVLHSLLETIYGPQPGAVVAALAGASANEKVLLGVGFELPAQPAEPDVGMMLGPTTDLGSRIVVSAKPDRLKGQLAANEDASLLVLPLEDSVLSVEAGESLDLVAGFLGGEQTRRALLSVPLWLLDSRYSSAERDYISKTFNVTDLVRVPYRSGIVDREHALLRCVAQRQPSRSTRFIVLTRDARRSNQIAEAVSAGVNGAESFDVGFDVRLPEFEPWNEGHLHPERGELQAKAMASERVARLDELACVLVSETLRTQDDINYPFEVEAYAMDPIIESGTESVEEGQVLFNSAIIASLPELHSLPFRNYADTVTRLERGDIVARPDVPSAWYSVPDEYEGVIAGPELVIIRGTPEVIRDFTLTFLNSRVVWRLLPAPVTVGDLARLPLPQPDPEAFSSAIRSLRTIAETESAVVSHLRELQIARDSSFTPLDGNEVAARLQEASERALVLRTAFARQDDSSRTFRDVYPYPVARAVRQFEQSSGHLESYNSALRVVESLIVVLGSISAAWAIAAELTPPSLRSLLLKFSANGPAFGDWLAVLRDVGAHARKAEHDPVGVGEATRSRGKNRGLLHDLEKLLSERNDASHGRGPRNSGSARERMAEVEAWLTSALSGSALLSDSRWVVPDRADWTSIERRFRISALSLMGDHPDFERVEFERSEPMESGIVYLLPREGPPLELAPFLSLLDCEQCQHPELYFVDQLRDAGARLVSLSTPHTITATAPAQRLRIISEKIGPIDGPD
jgi:hypothetical protein